MIFNFVKTISGTPYWVWIALIYLLFIGVEALRPRVVSLYRVAIIPMIFIIWSLSALYFRTITSSVLWPIFNFFWCIGSFVGYQMLSREAIFVDKQTRLIHLSGSVVLLLLSLSFFFVKYCFGVSYALHPELKFNQTIVGIDVLLSGIFSGISSGRFLKILHVYRTTAFAKRS